MVLRSLIHATVYMQLHWQRRRETRDYCSLAVSPSERGQSDLLRGPQLQEIRRCVCVCVELRGLRYRCTRPSLGKRKLAAVTGITSMPSIVTGMLLEQQVPG